jgi:hypothetical protein
VFTSERIGKFKLRAGVAAAEVGDAEIGTQQIGAVAEQANGTRLEGAGVGIIPEIFQMGKFDFR